MAAAESSSPPAAEASKPVESTETTAESTQAPTADQPAAEKPVEKPAADQVDGAGSPGNGNPLADTELKVEVKLADLQADPNNPLFSAKTFEELQLSDELLKGIHQMNFRKPSKIQEKALPLLLINPPQNMIAQSQSGTGKTAAFSLNILSRIDINNVAPQALVLAPSRELARQILGVISHMGQFIEGLKTMAAVPDPSRRGMKYEAHVLVGTPGTAMDMIRRRLLDPRSIKILVLDEADNMLDQGGLGEQCTRVKALIPGSFQTVLFSATFPDHVINFAQRFAPNANVITLAHEELTIEGIKQLCIDCPSESGKYDVLLKFYGLMSQASSIIFVRKKQTAEELEARMTADGHKVAQLSGNLEGDARDRVIDAFRNGDAKVLITTNVLARGIDVQSVTMVINFDVPTMANGRDPDPETYLHRIGRTGRFGRVGVALTLIHDRQTWEQLHAIADYYKTEVLPLPLDDWDTVEETITKVIKNSRAGKSTMEMTN
ncbi:RNA helicase required for poly(A+) mRNA export [Paraphaeosphaeria sporulosa]|uniref:RNA helicase n=1 Tax=Paraphaeosphaeria sporulosa TaxID=1460663 RepID=A0A177CMV7_9PLEO|nr:P-loop containing nucleoside triphosphate hydrolase protein [Paraphaeosphaeria sporulosa]OAG08591.1 P-loop containing nucleoside triphosphate hydrolase protein [Paraphaeosphaeria sporulosa]